MLLLVVTTAPILGVPSAAGDKALTETAVAAAPRHRRFTQAQRQDFWTLADAENPAAADWVSASGRPRLIRRAVSLYSLPHRPYRRPASHFKIDV